MKISKLFYLLAAVLAVCSQTVDARTIPAGKRMGVSGKEFPSPARVEASQVSVIPAPGEVTSLKTFEVTIEGATELTRGNVQYSNAPYVIADGSDDKKYCFSMQFEGNKMTLSVSAEITDPGNYTFHIPAGFYNIDGEPATDEFSFEYTIAGSVTPSYTYSVTPAPGEVASLQTFEVTVEGATEVTKGNVQYSNAPYVIAEGSSDKKYCFSMQFEGNKMTLATSSEITEPGNYTFHVPAGFYDIDGAAATEEQTFDYTIPGSVTPSYTYSVTPAPGEVASLQTFEVTVEGATEVTKGNVQYSTAPYVIAEGSDEKKYCFSMQFEGNKMTLATSSEITEPGNYTFHVPAEFYNIDGVAATEEQTFDYTIPTPPSPYTYSVTPAPGEVASLQTFEVTVEGATEVTKGNVQYSNAPYVIAEGSSDKKYCFSMQFEGNKMTLATSAEITEPGNYTFHVPAGFYDIDGEAATEEQTFDYIITEPSPYTYTVTPAPGNVTSLQTFEVTVEGATEVTKGNVQYSTAPYVIAEGSDEKKYCFSMQFEGNKMTLATTAEITELGNYTFHVPAGFYNIDGVAATESHSFDYQIVEAIEADIITEQPAGTRVDCQTEFLSWYVVSGILGGMPLDGKPTHYVIGDDDCLYLYNPILIKPYGAQQTSSYLKGVKEGDEYVFTFPQPIATEMVDGEEQILYVNFMHNVETEGGSTYEVVESDNKYSFKILENGDCVPTAESDEMYIVGYTDVEGNWQGFGNVDMKYLKFNYTAHEIPENVTVQDWIMEYSKGGSDQRLQTDVQVVIKDNEVWVKGFSQTFCPDAWAYGTIDDNNVINFHPYLGEASSVGQYAFVYNGLVNSTSNEIRPLVMNYDPENKKIVDDEDLLINPNQVFYYTLENYVLPVLTDNTIELTTKIPEAPKQINTFFILDSETGYSSVSINLATENTDGQPLNSANLYYQILLPGFKSFEVYTFEPDLYSEIDEPITDLPFNMLSGLVYGTGLQRNMYVYVPDYDNIGARMVYKDETGVYYSKPTFYIPVDYDDSVKDINTDAELVETEWYNLEGQRIANPQENGLFIKKNIYNDGSVRTSKIMIRL